MPCRLHSCHSCHQGGRAVGDSAFPISKLTLYTIRATHDERVQAQKKSISHLHPYSYADSHIAQSTYANFHLPKCHTREKGSGLYVQIHSDIYLEELFSIILKASEEGTRGAH